jgi:methyltransferase OMS1, mitochondrial
VISRLGWVQTWRLSKAESPSFATQKASSSSRGVSPPSLSMFGFASPLLPLSPPRPAPCSQTRNSLSPRASAAISRRHALGSLSTVVLSLLLHRNPAAASHATAPADPSAIAEAYDKYSSRYNVLDGATSSLPRVLGYADRRAAAVAKAAGRTLEVACGTGENFPLYARAPRVTSVTALDISFGMLAGAAAARREAQLGFTVELVQGDCAALPFGDEAFDTVLDTFSLCVFPEPLRALREMRRVLKRERGARVLLVEHSVSSVPPLASWQNATAGVVASTSKGCFWNQDVVGLTRQAGLVVVNASSGLAGTLTSLELVRDDADA